MAQKTVEIPGIGLVTLYKRRSARHIRLSVTAEGQIRISQPTWVPYSTGIAFARQKATWLQQQQRPPILLENGMRIGKSHFLEFTISPSGKLISRVTPALISVKLPAHMPAQDPKTQALATKACIRALKQEAEDVLPGRLRKLAAQYGFDFRSVEVKRLKSRWGSCNHRQEIVLNCFLMQLPWELVDYVLLHELMHTRIMAHGPRFWGELGEYVPDLMQKRKIIREHKPTVAEAISVSSMA